MAEQQFNYFERRAFWEAHAKRCAYCRDPLSFAQLEIDHILPESLLQDSQAWAIVRQEQGLPSNFSLLGYENLQPSCRACNGRKRDEPFPPGRTAIELGVARRNKSTVAELIIRFKRADKADKVRFALAGALQSGELSESEIAQTVSKARADLGSFRLSTNLPLFGEESLRDISRANYEHYLSARISLPPVMKDGLRLVSNDGQEVHVSTLRDFQAFHDKGFYAFSTFEMNVAFQYFERPLTLLHILQKARIADQNYIDDPRIGLADISLLPATLLFVTEDMTDDPAFAGQKDRLKGRSIQDLVSSGDARLSMVGSESIGVDYDYGHTFMFEIMRADMNGNGIQDMLIHWGARPVTGTYRTASVVVLTRLSEAEMFSVASDDGLEATR